MKPGQSARLALRAATGDWHERVDAVFSTADLADRAGYARFLAAQAAAYIPVEEALERDGAGNLLADWPSRRRADLLRQDLSALGQEVPSAPALPVFSSEAAMLGAVYVLEGSRLGGTMLKRSVPAYFPSAFLGGGDSALWRDLLHVLDHGLQTENGLAAATKAACDVFALFEASGQRFLTDGAELERG